MNKVVFQKDRRGCGALMTTGSWRGSGERRNSFLKSYDDGQMGERDGYMKVEEVGGTPVTCWETSNESWWSYVSRIRPRVTQRQATRPCWGGKDGHLAKLAVGGFTGGVGRCDLNLERGTLEAMTRHNEMDPRHPSRTPPGTSSHHSAIGVAVSDHEAASKYLIASVGGEFFRISSARSSAHLSGISEKDGCNCELIVAK